MATKAKDKSVIAAKPTAKAKQDEVKTFEEAPVLHERRVTDLDKLNVKKVTTIKANNDKEFHTLCQRIKVSGEILASTIHNAGLYALAQVNIHGQTQHGLMLIDAIGTKHEKVRVLRWLMTFGKFGYKNKLLIYKKRKDINPETVEAWLRRADETPYWDLTPQQEMNVTFDYLSMLKSLVTKHNSITDLQSKGKKVEEKNVGVLEEVMKLLKKFEPDETVKAA